MPFHNQLLLVYYSNKVISNNDIVNLQIISNFKTQLIPLKSVHKKTIENIHVSIHIQIII